VAPRARHAAPVRRRSVSRHAGERLTTLRREALQTQGIGTILTHLGENLVDASEAEGVTGHYLEVLSQIRSSGLDTRISVKLTQLGLDFDAALCQKNLLTLVQRAEALGNLVWIDMEGSDYVDRTLEQYRNARLRSAQVGICLQAYLRRTAADLESLLPLGPSVRLVKGAYKEPATIAFARKADVDHNFYTLATSFLSARESPFSRRHPRSAVAAGSRLSPGASFHPPGVRNAVWDPARLQQELIGAADPESIDQLRRILVPGTCRPAESRANVLFGEPSAVDRVGRK
jgi:proline dehydrogenase